MKVGCFLLMMVDTTDMYSKRIMFPLWDTSWKVVGFSVVFIRGRYSKYINTKETPIFKKENYYIIIIGPKMK